MAEKQQLIKIVRELKSGNKDMAAVLYEVYYRDLHYYILKRVNDPEKAEVLTKETFIDIFETIGTLGDSDHFVEWSRQVADQRCDLYRESRKRLLFEKVGKSTVDSIAEERRNLHADESTDTKMEDQPVYLMPDSLSEEQNESILKKAIRSGAKIVESIARKVIVGVVAALILAGIREVGVDWIYRENITGSESSEDTEQTEATEELKGTGENGATEEIETTEEIVTAEEIKTTEEIETTEEIDTTEVVGTTEVETIAEIETTAAETETVPVTTNPETTKAEETKTQAEEATAPEMVELRLQGRYWEVVGIGTYRSADVVIPSTYEGLPIECILNDAFLYYHRITTMQLPDGLLEIRGNAFRGCEKMTTINLPDSIFSIGPNAFCGCISLTSITLPAHLTQIMEGAFNGCREMTQITFTENISSIGAKAFSGCMSLTEIDLPAGVKSIAADAFYYCHNLEKIIVDEGNPVYYSVDNCLITKSSKKLVLCGKNSKIPTDGSITSIGDYACENCQEWTEVVIPDGVTSIGDYAFDALKLEKITIPESVTSIGERAFGLSGKLKVINYSGTSKQWKTIEKGVDWNLHAGNYTVYCTDGEIPQWEDVG